IVTAPDGSLVAVVEARKYNAHDPGLTISTWSARGARTAAKPGRNSRGSMILASAGPRAIRRWWQIGPPGASGSSTAAGGRVAAALPLDPAPTTLRHGSAGAKMAA